ncbi:hypothetical protein HK405_009924 [Cladochytrium tenue]|nr:hypothetical protein HK405_009924 [Cladochytrium tenue]
MGRGFDLPPPATTDGADTAAAGAAGAAEPLLPPPPPDDGGSGMAGGGGSSRGSLPAASAAVTAGLSTAAVATLRAGRLAAAALAAVVRLARRGVVRPGASLALWLPFAVFVVLLLAMTSAHVALRDRLAAVVADAAAAASAAATAATGPAPAASGTPAAGDTSAAPAPSPMMSYSDPWRVSPTPALACWSCFGVQLKFLLGAALFGDRINDRERCSRVVLDAAVPHPGGPHPQPRWQRRRRRPAAGSVPPPLPVVPLPGVAGGNVTVEWVLYATSCTAGLNRLAGSITAAGIPLTVLGLHTSWRGWGQRLRAYHDHAAGVLARDGDYDRLLIFTDGEDVVLSPACSASDLVERWLVLRGLTGGAIIAAAEKSLWNVPWVAESYEDMHSGIVHRPSGVRDPRHQLRKELRGDAPPSRRGGGPEVFNAVWTGPGTPMRHLNAGTIMGRAADIEALLRRIYVDECMDDQHALTYAYCRRDVRWVVSPETNDEAAAAAPEPHEAEDAIDAFASRMAKAEERYGVRSPQYASARRELARTVASKVLAGDGGDVAAVIAAREASPDDTTPPPTWYRVSAGLGRPAPAAGGIGNGGVEAVEAEPPFYARPLVALDFEAELFAALYNVTLGDFHPVSDAVPSAGGAAAGVGRFAARADAEGSDDGVGEVGGNVEAPPPSPPTPPPPGAGRFTGPQAGHVALEYGATLGTPCVFHQSGAKVSNRVLEELAQLFGQRFNAKAIARAERLRAGAA